MNFIERISYQQRYYNIGIQFQYCIEDSVGHEIDVIIEQGAGLYPVEIKSGQTITSEYFRNLSFWQSLNGSTSGSVVYAGTTKQRRSNGIEVIPWQELGDSGIKNQLQ